MSKHRAPNTRQALNFCLSSSRFKKIYRGNREMWRKQSKRLRSETIWAQLSLLDNTFQALAKELMRSRRTVNRFHENRAQLNSISMHLGESVAIARTVGHLSKSAEVMKLVNDIMKAPEMAATMQEFSREMTKAGIIEEFANDALDDALDTEDIEEEIEEEVDKVLESIAGETTAQLPAAVRKGRMKQPAQTAGASWEEEAIAEGVDDEDDMEEIRARLAKVRS